MKSNIDNFLYLLVVTLSLFCSCFFDLHLFNFGLPVLVVGIIWHLYLLNHLSLSKVIYPKHKKNKKQKTKKRKFFN